MKIHWRLKSTRTIDNTILLCIIQCVDVCVCHFVCALFSVDVATLRWATFRHLTVCNLLSAYDANGVDHTRLPFGIGMFVCFQLFYINGLESSWIWHGNAHASQPKHTHTHWKRSSLHFVGIGFLFQKVLTLWQKTENRHTFVTDHCSMQLKYLLVKFFFFWVPHFWMCFTCQPVTHINTDTHTHTNIDNVWILATKIKKRWIA